MRSNHIPIGSDRRPLDNVDRDWNRVLLDLVMALVGCFGQTADELETSGLGHCFAWGRHFGGVAVYHA